MLPVWTKGLGLMAHTVGCVQCLHCLSGYSCVYHALQSIIQVRLRSFLSQGGVTVVDLCGCMMRQNALMCGHT